MGQIQDKKIEQAQVEIGERLKHLPSNFLDCRDPGLRHKWDKTSDFHVIPVTHIGRKISNLARVETCERCGCRKVEKFIVNRFDQIEKIGQTYEYPEGYLMKGVNVPRGMKRSSTVWGENYRRAMETAAGSARGGTTRATKKKTAAKTRMRKAG